jgi:hypothetical protein
MRAATVSAATLLRLPVRLRGIELARPVDLVLDRDRRRVLGLELRCGDEGHRFLPLAAATVHHDQIDIRSPLVMLDRAQLAFYTERGSTLAALRGSTMLRRGEALGALADLELATDGTIEHVVLEGPEGRLRVPYDGDVAFGRRGPIRAAS